MKSYTLTDGGESLINQLIEFIPNEVLPTYTHKREADYVFHSVFGKKVLKHEGIRIFATGENVIPDFNIVDYAIGFNYISFEDRYKRIPLYRFYKEAYQALCAPRPDPISIINQKNKFCLYVMSNTKNSAPERIAIYHALNEYKTVSSGGRWHNNIGGPVKDKIAFQSTCKFALAIENSSSPGYCTEKFAQAAQSNCVPIYWGDPTIAQQFNPKSFINAHEFNSFNELKEAVRKIDNDDGLYRSMLEEPWFINGEEPLELRHGSIAAFLENIFTQTYSDAFRRNRSRWGEKYARKFK